MAVVFCVQSFLDKCTGYLEKLANSSPNFMACGPIIKWTGERETLELLCRLANSLPHQPTILSTLLLHADFIHADIAGDGIHVCTCNVSTYVPASSRQTLRRCTKKLRLA